jgi:hypothetical protein
MSAGAIGNLPQSDRIKVQRAFGEPEISLPGTQIKSIIFYTEVKYAIERNDNHLRTEY